MKKILLILILLFVVHLNAYEYMVFNSGTYIAYYTDETNTLKLRVLGGPNDLNLNYISEDYLIHYNGIIKYHLLSGAISNDLFKNYLKNDLNLLDDFYTQSDISRNAILNYFYNNERFDRNNYLQYTDYQILYNADGLAVESIIGGVWAGLYDDNEKYQSGDLYDNLGRLQYYNGEPATPVDSFYVWLARFTHRVVEDAFLELSRTMVFGTILVILLVLAMLYFCMENFLFVRLRRRSRPYYLYGEDGSRHTFRQVELEGKNYARLNPEWAQRRREENDRARAGR